MLHEAQRTLAPSAFSVSISTAVWIVMCSDPAIRAPRSGWIAAYSSRIAMRPGISVSAMAISFRPQSASEKLATLKSVSLLDCGAALISRPPFFRKKFASAVAVSILRAWLAWRPVATLLGEGELYRRAVFFARPSDSGHRRMLDP